jgi:magnesium-transporting ATPase (P-type)
MSHRPDQPHLLCLVTDAVDGPGQRSARRLIVRLPDSWACSRTGPYGAEATRRLAEHGPNERPPSIGVVARGQLANPMNIILVIVCAASFAIGLVAAGAVVLG